ncbi:hypothetical protein VaNZ11_009112, partial [Volvox africanus]
WEDYLSCSWRKSAFGRFLTHSLFKLMFVPRIQGYRACTLTTGACFTFPNNRKDLIIARLLSTSFNFFTKRASSVSKCSLHQAGSRRDPYPYKGNMATAEEEQIAQVVMDFLKTTDMNVTTERIVLKHVQNNLSLEKPISEYKGLVSETIEKFLEELDAAEGHAEGDGGGGGGGGDVDDDEDDGGGGGEDEPEGEAGAKRGRKRKGSSAGTASKRSRGGTDEVLFSKDLSRSRKARVRKWDGKLHVDVREFYQADGAEAPTQKGLAMDPVQWARLARDLPQLLAAQRNRNAGAPATQLSKTRVAAVSEFKGTFYLGLREYYEKDGQLLPSKKGVNLSPSEAEALLAVAADITAAAGGNVELPPPLSPQQEKEAMAAPSHANVPPASAPSGWASRAAAPAPSATATGGGAGGAGGAGGPGAPPQEVVDLGGNKRLSISRFQGRLSVDLREFYEKNGEMLPGKKGIALSPPDWATLSSHLHDVDAALTHKDMGFCLRLSGMRRVSLSEFKGVTYVGVREYYDKGGGELVPGHKGLNMSPAQWAACVAGAPAINAALQQAQAGR